MHKDSTPKIFLVATLLCLICSTLVSTTAVLLKARQKQNIEVDKKTKYHGHRWAHPGKG